MYFIVTDWLLLVSAVLVACLVKETIWAIFTGWLTVLAARKKAQRQVDCERCQLLSKWAVAHQGEVPPSQLLTDHTCGQIGTQRAQDRRS
jgi:hypothetical protein